MARLTGVRSAWAGLAGSHEALLEHGWAACALGSRMASSWVAWPRGRQAWVVRARGRTGLWPRGVRVVREARDARAYKLSGVDWYGVLGPIWVLDGWVGLVEPRRS